MSDLRLGHPQPVAVAKEKSSPKTQASESPSEISRANDLSWILDKISETNSSHGSTLGPQSINGDKEAGLSALLEGWWRDFRLYYGTPTGWTLIILASLAASFFIPVGSPFLGIPKEYIPTIHISSQLGWHIFAILLVPLSVLTGKICYLIRDRPYSLSKYLAVLSVNFALFLASFAAFFCGTIGSTGLWYAIVTAFGALMVDD
ncbi:MAG TPA: hypothetical protein VKM72_22240 [Thermoanaerobaculia bacterium]|nr:hypothetical protein [Thermoanaerobaculia bacterium]